MAFVSERVGGFGWAAAAPQKKNGANRKKQVTMEGEIRQLHAKNQQAEEWLEEFESQAKRHFSLLSRSAPPGILVFQAARHRLAF